MFEIIKYEDKYKDGLMHLIRGEGDDWDVYWKEPNASRYAESFARSLTYIALNDGEVCGYSRSLKDALYIYVCDLLVGKEYRGNGLGEKLIKCIRRDFPEYPIYIMSGSDGYYQSLGCKREGSIYLFG